MDRLTRTHFWSETIEFLRKLPVPNGVVVNIGAYWESSTISILLDKPLLFAFSIDTEICEIGLENLEHFGMTNRVVRVLGKSQDVGAYWPFPISMVYIDGDHSYETTKTDIEMWVPLVVPGGIVAFHDYGTPHTPGVVRAVDEAMGDYECLGFDRPDRGVLKVFRK